MRTRSPEANKQSTRFWNRNFRRSKYNAASAKTAARVLYMVDGKWTCMSL